MHSNSPSPILASTPAQLVQALVLRQQALTLLRQAAEIDRLHPFMVVHRHAYGASAYTLWATDMPRQEDAERVLDEQFEPHRGEKLDVFDDTTLEALTGVSITHRLPDLIAAKSDADAMAAIKPAALGSKFVILEPGSLAFFDAWVDLSRAIADLPAGHDFGTPCTIGDFMLMHADGEGVVYFKHKLTRAYLPVKPSATLSMNWSVRSRRLSAEEAMAKYTFETAIEAVFPWEAHGWMGDAKKWWRELWLASPQRGEPAVRACFTVEFVGDELDDCYLNVEPARG